MRSFKVQTSSLLAMALMLAPGFAFADKNEDLYKEGIKYYNQGNAIAAKEAFCAIDPGHSDAKAKCAEATKEADNQVKDQQKRYEDGVKAFQNGNLDEAEKKFKSIKYGQRVQSAAKQLELIAEQRKLKADQDAVAKAGADADAGAKAKYDDGVRAFGDGKFTEAKVFLGAVSGKYQGDAQGYLSKINNYELKMREGDSFAAAKNNDAAKAAYTEAARIAPNGPGDPFAKMQGLGSSSSASAPVPPKPTTSASKDAVKAIDIPKTLADAKRAVARNDFKLARRLFNDILAQDYRNADANAGINALPADQSASGGKEDAQLAGLIRLYFDGRYEEAEEGFKFYLFSEKKDKKMGLANFFQGASLLSRYYLSGGTEEKLMQDAKLKFKDAKTVEGFIAPAKFVSPKIMKVFNAS